MRRDLAGLALDDVTRAELEALWLGAIAACETLVTYGYSLTVIPKLRDHPEIAEIGNTFDVMLCDGRGLFYVANLAGERIREHLSLPDAVELACDVAESQHLRMFLLGATAEVNAEAVARLERRGITAAGRDGYFSMSELDALCEELRRHRPQILLVGITSPKKEIVAEYLRTRLEGTVIIPCGGMIDVLAGLTRREPRLVQKLGAAWLYRWFQEPRRLWRPVLVNGVYAMLWLVPQIMIRKRLLDAPFSIVTYLSGRTARTR